MAVEARQELPLQERQRGPARPASELILARFNGRAFSSTTPIADMPKDALEALGGRGTPNLSPKSELAAKMALGSLGTSGGRLRGSLRHAANMRGQSNGVCAGCMRSASNQPVFMEHCTIRSMPIPHVPSSPKFAGWSHARCPA